MRMPSLLFIHGTGVREPRFSELFTCFSERIGRIAAGAVCEPCYWGGELGSTLAAGGLSVPGFDTSRDGAAASAEPAAVELAAWAELYRDPLAELALHGAASPQIRELPPGAPHPAERPRALLSALAASPVLDEFQGAPFGLGGLPSALSELARNPLLGPASAVLDDDGLAWVLARSLVAASISTALDQDTAAVCDGTLRDETVELLAVTMGAKPQGSDRGLGRGALALLGRPALRLATRSAVRRRRSLTEGAQSTGGDVLLYLARGEPIRRRLREAVERLTPPVVLVGHSLGGVAAVDTLVLSRLPQVELLVTVGSQAPFLYETGSLPSLLHPEPLPPDFPAWLNIYDPVDLLGYLGAGVFPGRVEDVAVGNRQPFPAAHSAYWTNDAVYRAIGARLP